MSWVCGLRSVPCRRGSPGKLVGRALRLAAVGVLMGLTASWWVTSLLSSLLIATDAHDTRVFAAGAMAMVTVAAGAAWWPARRAARLDPATVLRAE